MRYFEDLDVYRKRPWVATGYETPPKLGFQHFSTMGVVEDSQCSADVGEAASVDLGDGRGGARCSYVTLEGAPAERLRAVVSATPDRTGKVTVCNSRKLTESELQARDCTWTEHRSTYLAGRSSPHIRKASLYGAHHSGTSPSTARRRRARRARCT